MKHPQPKKRRPLVDPEQSIEKPPVAKRHEETSTRDQSQLPEIYYDLASLNYFIRAKDERFIKTRPADIVLKLKGLGFSHDREDGCLSQVDELMQRFREEDYVQLAGPLAGYSPGRHDFPSGDKMLVTQGPTFLEPTEPTGPLNLFNRDCYLRMLGPEQAQHIFGNLKIARESLRRSLKDPKDKRIRWRGPVIAISGDIDQFKSMLAQKVFVPLLGGRQARPQQAMQGGTTFNRDLFSGECQVLDDAGSEDRYVLRKKFGDSIKQITGDECQRCHGKGQDGLLLKPFWRMLVNTNDEHEDILIYPPLSRGMSDKITILKTIGPAITTKVTNSEEYAATAQKIEDGLNDFAWWIDNIYKIPSKLIGGRWGIVTWQHPEIVAALTDSSPAEKVLYLIDNSEFFEGDKPVEMSSFEIETNLTDGLLGEATKRLIRSTESLGKYLSRLSREHPDRVQKMGRVIKHDEKGRIGSGGVRWRLIPAKQ